MAAKPLTSEAIAITEKKMDMTLDDIIKMSKNRPNRNKKQRGPGPGPNKNQGVFKDNAGKRNPNTVWRYLDSRSSVRQSAFAQRRSNFHGNQFPVTTEVAKKAAVTSVRNGFFKNNGMVNRNKYRVGPSPVQRKAFGQNTAVKEQAKAGTGPKPNTLDARFANLREQRMKSFPVQNNSGRMGGGQRQFQHRRNQFGK